MIDLWSKHAMIKGSSASWSVLLRGLDGVQAVEGGAAQVETLGVRLVPAEGVHHLVVRL
jgi:hypothetical protein